MEQHNGKVLKRVRVDIAPQERRLVSASFPDLELLGYGSDGDIQAREIYKAHNGKHHKLTAKYRAFKNLCLDPKRINGTLTFSNGSTEPVEWTFDYYRQEYEERLRHL